MPGPSLAEHRVVHALARFLALKIGRERHRTEQELIRRALHQQLAVLEIREAPNAGDGQLFQRVRGFDLFTSETRDFRHDQDVER